MSKRHSKSKLKEAVTVILTDEAPRSTSKLRKLLRDYPKLWARFYEPPLLVNGRPAGKGKLDLKGLYTCLGIELSYSCKSCGIFLDIETKYGRIQPRNFCSVRCSANSVSTRSKYEATCMKKWGVANAWSADEVKSKIKTTFKSMYGGIDHPLKVPHIWNQVQRARYRTKEFVDAHGKNHLCQGYEPVVLEKLQRSSKVLKFTTDAAKIPRIEYQLEGTAHTYYPDIRILLEGNRNICLEVKSEWTLRGKSKTLQMNLAKFAAAERKLAKLENWEFWLALVYPDKDLLLVKNPFTNKHLLDVQ